MIPQRYITKLSPERFEELINRLGVYPGWEMQGHVESLREENQKLKEGIEELDRLVQKLLHEQDYYTKQKLVDEFYGNQKSTP